MSNVAVFGAGYVGLVTGACLAQLGHDVVVRDVDEEKVVALQAGTVPIPRTRATPTCPPSGPWWTSCRWCHTASSS
jgi:UDP-N-acetyl-D-mannosaminuronate dehydrogenase